MSNDPIIDVNLDNKKASECVLYLQEYLKVYAKYEEKIQSLEKENSNLRKNHGELANYIKDLNLSEDNNYNKLKSEFDTLFILYIPTVTLYYLSICQKMSEITRFFLSIRKLK